MIKKYTKNSIVFVVLLVFLFAPIFVFTVFAEEGTRRQAEIQNPLGPQNQTLIALIGNLLKLAAQIGAVFCVFFIIYSGFLFIKAQGKEDELTKAKSVFFWSVVGTAILLGASVVADLISGTVNSVLR
jgi:lysylphosphatidylglycerol synthetase-like protein (DUF2156 family)